MHLSIAAIETWSGFFVLTLFICFVNFILAQKQKKFSIIYQTKTNLLSIYGFAMKSQK